MKLTLCFLCSLQLQKPEDIGTDREHDRPESELIPRRARDLAWTKTWITWRGPQRKPESSRIVSQPALSVELSWLSPLKAVLRQVLAKLKDLVWLNGTNNPTARCQIRTLSCTKTCLKNNKQKHPDESSLLLAYSLFIKC